MYGAGLTRQSRQDEDKRLRLGHQFGRVRAASEGLAEGLSPEDQVIQSMTDASPTKWHLAHTTWFFETFILGPLGDGYAVFHPRYSYLFNSYYEAVGDRHARPRRGMLTRPSVDEVMAYRAHVDRAMAAFIADCSAAAWQKAAPLLELGLHHEMQHQELLLTDLLHALAQNPLCPAYRPHRPAEAVGPVDLTWASFDGGAYEIGHDGPGFAFDHETPRHRTLVQPFKLGSRLVTNGEWQAFMTDGGYRTPTLWLSDGWATAAEENWSAPLYWQMEDDGWHSMTLAGLQPVNDDAPVVHVSHYEADAYARWAGQRLPTEAEWEVAAARMPLTGNYVESGMLRALPAGGGDGSLQQMFGDAWEWTQSPYISYPGFRPAAGAVGEYNGKFMANQIVLRGGSCVTPEAQMRTSYRNFFYPHQRWQFSGVRLAADV